MECQRNHRPQHKQECKKRAAELKDDLLFKQPESTCYGDCPICLLPIYFPISQDTVKSTLYECCSKIVCDGCNYANYMREREARLPPSCPFCRTPEPKTEEETNLNIMKRVEANDPEALNVVGMSHFDKGDYATAFEYWEKAVGLGHFDSHYHLSCMYYEGRGVERDMKKHVYHKEQAAIGGHPIARHNLGKWEWKAGNKDKAVKHWTIAANLGFDPSVDVLKMCYQGGVVNHDDFTAALRAHQAAVDATKSPQRAAAEAAKK